MPRAPQGWGNFKVRVRVALKLGLAVAISMKGSYRAKYKERVLGERWKLSTWEWCMSCIRQKIE